MAWTVTEVAATWSASGGPRPSLPPWARTHVTAPTNLGWHERANGPPGPSELLCKRLGPRTPSTPSTPGEAAEKQDAQQAGRAGALATSLLRSSDSDTPRGRPGFHRALPEGSHNLRPGF